ncbi:MAG: division/cell wall cluster transcriptional repressor MraZ [Christensenellaceae bacterium]|jgi:MraZ protein|nr:division/cell wall cluster transcriptional repressor MraZ [Christensenellaceae bacterium]
MLSGEFKHVADEKFRLRLPPKFKKELGSGYVVTRGNDGCLFVFSHEQLEALLNKTSSIPMFSSNLQQPLRLLYSSAYEVAEDNQGRFLLPQSLRDAAAIKKEVYFVGVGTRAEIWSAERWEEYKKQGSVNFDDIVEELGKYGI